MVNVADYSQSNLGKIEIAPEVLSVIASIATSEVEGIKEDGIYIDVFCSLKHGVNISKTANQIQSAIFNSITTMTAIEPQQINIHIRSIVAEK